MSLLDTILNSQNGAALQHIAAQAGIAPDQAASALSALVPALAAGVQRNTQTSSGLSGLLGALATGDHQQYINDPSSLATAGGVQDGAAILSHILGGQSGQVLSHVSAQTGIGADVLQQVMPMAAAALMGAMAHHVNTSPAGTGGVGGSLLNMIASTATQGAGLSGGLGGLLGRILGQ